MSTFLTLPWKEKSGHFDLRNFAEFRGILEHALKHMVFWILRMSCGILRNFRNFRNFRKFRNSCLFPYSTYSIKQEHRNMEHGIFRILASFFFSNRNPTVHFFPSRVALCGSSVSPSKSDYTSKFVSVHFSDAMW